MQKGALRFIDEWVDYYLAIVFEKIYVYDNSDDFELERWYNDDEDDDIVGNRKDHIQVKHFPGQAKQIPAYEDCSRSIRERREHSWVAYYDLDEFLVIRDTRKYPNVMDYLNTVPDNVGAIAVNWQMFYFNNQMKYEPKPVTLRFPGHETKLYPHVKSIVRAEAAFTFLDPHHVRYEDAKTRQSSRYRSRYRQSQLQSSRIKGSGGQRRYVTVDTAGNIVDGPFNERKPNDVLTLFHYNTKSLEEFKERCQRGRADIASFTHEWCNMTDEEIVSRYPNQTINDDSAWKILKERVPERYSKYE